MPENHIEEHIGLTQHDSFEQTTSGDSVTTKHIFVDGGDGKEKEATTRSAHAGASSEALPSSGIPSAKTQHGVSDVTAPQAVTPLADRVQSTRQTQEP